MTQLLSRLAVLLCVCCCPVSAWAVDAPGLASEQPSTGPHVSAGDRFLVPYAQRIPGTDVEFDMVAIPGGTFTMGSPPEESERRDDEGPQVRIRLEPYWMGKHEITWSEFWEFMQLDSTFTQFAQLRSMIQRGNESDIARAARTATATLPELKRLIEKEPNFVDAVTAPTALYDPSTTYESGEAPRQPAVTMTPYAARQYTKWLSAITGIDYRLPTEAEWEHAARAGSQSAYYFGNDPADLDQHAWYFENADERSHLVGKKQANPWGLHDVHGNVAEWVLDAYAEDRYAELARQASQSATGPILASTDAVSWPETQYPRVVRGGFWDSEAEDLRSAARMASDDETWKASDPNLPNSPWWYTEYPAGGIGFRIMRPFHAMSDEDKQRAWEIDARDIRLDVTDRLKEGRGKLDIVGPSLPEAIRQMESASIRKLLGDR